MAWLGSAPLPFELSFVLLQCHVIRGKVSGFVLASEQGSRAESSNDASAAIQGSPFISSTGARVLGLEDVAATCASQPATAPTRGGWGLRGSHGEHRAAWLRHGECSGAPGLSVTRLACVCECEGGSALNRLAD